MPPLERLDEPRNERYAALYGQPHWYLFDDEGKQYDSFSSRWNDYTGGWVDDTEYSEQGIVYPLTSMSIVRCLILPSGSQTPVEILPPVPLPFFSFARYGLPVFAPGITVPRWLYSLFGFFFDDYRFTWKVENSEKLIASIDKRSIPLAL